MRSAVLALGIHFLAGALAVQSPTVEVEFDRDGTFLNTKLTPGRALRRSRTARRTRFASRKRSPKAEGIGLSPKTSEPDVLIRYGLEGENEKLHTGGTRRRSPWDPTDIETTVRLGDRKETLLVIEMFDAKTEALVWRARCSHRRPSSDLAAKRIQETVERLFEKYPTKVK